MRSTNTSKAIKVSAGIIAAMLLVVLLFSAFFIVAETHHDCAGEDCLICACIRICENALKGLGSFAAMQVSSVFAVIFVILAAVSSFTAVSSDTLVSNKVRLNN